MAGLPAQPNQEKLPSSPTTPLDISDCLDKVDKISSKMRQTIAEAKFRLKAVAGLFISGENCWANMLSGACFALAAIYFLFVRVKKSADYLFFKDTNMINQEIAKIASVTWMHILDIDVKYFVESHLWLGWYIFVMLLVFTGYQNLLHLALHRIPATWVNSNFSRFHAFTARFILLLNWMSLGLELLLSVTLWNSKQYTDVNDQYLEMVSSVVAMRSTFLMIMLYEMVKVEDLFEEVAYEKEYLEEAKLDDEECFHDEDLDDKEYLPENWIEKEAQILC